MWEHLPQPCQKGPTLTSINQCWNGSALTLSHVRNQSSMLKGSALISDNQCQKFLALIFDTCEETIQMCSKVETKRSSTKSTRRIQFFLEIWENVAAATQSYNHIRKACPTLTSDHVGTQPTIMLERPSTHI